MNKKVLIFDNGGETFDRYSILDLKTGDLCGASFNPFHPQGFAQFNHNVADDYWITAYGHGWRNRMDEKKLIKFAVDRYISEVGTSLGQVVSFESVPADVQKYIKETILEIV